MWRHFHRVYICILVFSWRTVPVRPKASCIMYYHFYMCSYDLTTAFFIGKLVYLSYFQNFLLYSSGKTLNWLEASVFLSFSTLSKLLSPGLSFFPVYPLISLYRELNKEEAPKYKSLRKNILKCKQHISGWMISLAIERVR